MEEPSRKRQRKESEQAPSGNASCPPDASLKKPKTVAAEDYFESYEDLGVHHLMLRDRPRSEAYRKAIEGNKEAFQGKVVLDVGTGTGLLAMFAARAGAKKVYAVEGSNMANVAQLLVEKNGFADRIQVIKGRMEEVELPEKVDIIVSEWMGFYLLHESMLDSVLYARDKWLNEGGLVFPSRSRIFLAPVNLDSYYEEHVTFWEDVYGLDYSALLPAVKAQLMAQPEIQITVEKEQLLSHPLLVKDIDCLSVSPQQLRSIKRNFELPILRDDTMHGFCVWFDVTFDPHHTYKSKSAAAAQGSDAAADAGDMRPTGGQVVVLSTAPGEKPTHWKQTFILLPADRGFAVNPDTTITGSMAMTTADDNARLYDLSIDLGELDPDPAADTTSLNGAEGEKEVEPEAVEEVGAMPGHEKDCQCGKCRLIRAYLAMEEEREGDALV